jgi:thioredoxin-related protein
MKFAYIFWITALFAIPALTQELQWNSFNDGMETAARSQNSNGRKKVIMDVFTDWCGWCKKMDKDVYSQSDIQAYLANNFILIKLNAESNNEVTYKDNQGLTESVLAADELGIDGYPSTVFFATDGEVITMVPGYVPPDKFLLMLKYIAEDHYIKEDWDQFLTSQEEEN